MSRPINPTTPPIHSTPIFNAKPIPPDGFQYPNKSNVYDGLIMTSGILLSTFLVKLVKKDMAPQFTLKNSASLALVVILSDYLVDLGKKYKYIPSSI